MSTWSNANREMELLIIQIKQKFEAIRSHLKPDDAGEIWYEKRDIDNLIKELSHFKEYLIRYRNLGKQIGKKGEADRLTELIRILKDIKPSPHWVKTVRSYFHILGIELDESKKELEAISSKNMYLMCLQAECPTCFDITLCDLYFSVIDDNTVQVLNKRPTSKCSGRLFSSPSGYVFASGFYSKRSKSFRPKSFQKLGRRGLVSPQVPGADHYSLSFFITTNKPANTVKNFPKVSELFKNKGPYFQVSHRCSCGQINDPLRQSCPSCRQPLTNGLNLRSNFKLGKKNASISVGFIPTMYDSLGSIQADYLLWSLMKSASLDEAKQNELFPESVNSVKKHYLHFVIELFSLALRKYSSFLTRDNLGIEATFVSEDMENIAAYHPFKSEPNLAVFKINFQKFLQEAIIGRKKYIYQIIKHELAHHLRRGTYVRMQKTTNSLSRFQNMKGVRDRMARFHLFVHNYVEEGIAMFAEGASKNLGEPVSTADIVRFDEYLSVVFLSSADESTKDSVETKLLYKVAHNIILVLFAYFAIRKGTDSGIIIKGVKQSYGSLVENSRNYPIKDISQAFASETLFALGSVDSKLTNKFMEYIKEMPIHSVLRESENAFGKLGIDSKYLTLTEKVIRGMLARIFLAYSKVKCTKCMTENSMNSSKCQNCHSDLKADSRFFCIGCGRPLDITFIFCPYCQTNQFSSTIEYNTNRVAFTKLAA